MNRVRQLSGTLSHPTDVNCPFREELIATAAAISTPGKGILAADESTGTITKRLNSINVEATLENRNGYRNLLITSPNWGEHISGIILYEEALFAKDPAGKAFVDIIREAGVIVGIKTDMGTRKLPFCPGEKYTQGLTDLDKRSKKYYEHGARFAKWRCVLSIQNGKISDTSIRETAWTLARYAAISQANGLCPIVEPEILMDGDHDAATNQYWTEKVLAATYKAMNDQHCILEGSLLKPNMVLPGKQFKGNRSYEENALRTVTALRRTVPSAVPGINFLSGGQSEEEATMNLNAMNKLGNSPWALSFSYGRALQASCLKTWKGKDENRAAAQQAFLMRAKANGMANLGKYDGFAADDLAKSSLYQKGYTY